ncbi:hypothetical protein DFW101_1922 [Solidesulfovibrio carbinoliphilus subsp. oakridgensis]|uniref:Uncharacterized protein n=1 Tax=Solidesulfovibrio carbinoliphilus subsp. oakridgensis TaxID=694327 RepID=G7Q501_9BACT|nr:hypothetical protein [Solidesulfovibrio carbinoliphilus]EHJ47928.1 hypothetical protein DFW101_1922 [Solidesulfovibrio carbinoliphilus subsp. oakridgensis]
MDVCQDPLLFLVERLCCRVYLDGGGNVRLGFSRRHDLKDMMTAQGIARSNAGVLRDRLRQGDCGGAGPDAAGQSADDGSMAGHVAAGAFCPLV